MQAGHHPIPPSWVACDPGVRLETGPGHHVPAAQGPCSTVPTQPQAKPVFPTPDRRPMLNNTQAAVAGGLPPNTDSVQATRSTMHYLGNLKSAMARITYTHVGASTSIYPDQMQKELTTPGKQSCVAMWPMPDSMIVTYQEAVKTQWASPGRHLQFKTATHMHVTDHAVDKGARSWPTSGGLGAGMQSARVMLTTHHPTSAC